MLNYQRVVFICHVRSLHRRRHTTSNNKTDFERTSGWNLWNDGPHMSYGARMMMSRGESWNAAGLYIDTGGLLTNVGFGDRGFWIFFETVWVTYIIQLRFGVLAFYPRTSRRRGRVLIRKVSDQPFEDPKSWDPCNPLHLFVGLRWLHSYPPWNWSEITEWSQHTSEWSWMHSRSWEILGHFRIVTPTTVYSQNIIYQYPFHLV